MMKKLLAMMVFGLTFSVSAFAGCDGTTGDGCTAQNIQTGCATIGYDSTFCGQNCTDTGNQDANAKEIYTCSMGAATSTTTNTTTTTTTTPQ